LWLNVLYPQSPLGKREKSQDPQRTRRRRRGRSHLSGHRSVPSVDVDVVHRQGTQRRRIRRCQPRRMTARCASPSCRPKRSPRAPNRRYGRCRRAATRSTWTVLEGACRCAPSALSSATRAARRRRRTAATGRGACVSAASAFSTRSRRPFGTYASLKRH
jgi:hypothetical protein